ncbi:STAS domain-containing protein [Streptomyces sp. NPDC056013]|uniref:STAS domain-containing protein n=1 Tax=Streptomyces sp. NPDC056013 TaxID=3345680 RepID=UPI0035E19016
MGGLGGRTRAGAPARRRGSTRDGLRPRTAENGHDPLDVDVITQSDHVVVAVAGELDITTCASLTQVTDVLALCDRALILKLDPSSVSFIDSSGLHTLLHLRRDIGNEGGTLELCGVTGQALRLLDITGTRPLFTVRRAA